MVETDPDSLRFALPLPSQASGGQLSIKRAGRKINEIGTKAGIVIDAVKSPRASARDLRQSFGTRWSKIVGEDQLKLMIRHKNIEMPSKYYGDIDADDVSSEIWHMAEAALAIKKQDELTSAG